MRIAANPSHLEINHKIVIRDVTQTLDQIASDIVANLCNLSEEDVDLLPVALSIVFSAEEMGQLQQILQRIEDSR
jgi:2-oxoglutarate dehydrogenase complex dehydrogenase (E1) component-like enzyme